MTPFCKIDLCRSEIYIYFTPKTLICQPHLRNLPFLMPFSVFCSPRTACTLIYTTRGRNITLKVVFYLNNKKGNTDQQLNMDSASRSPQPTPEASFDGSATINSISQENGFVNSENLATPVGQARNYAKILKMGENGTCGLVNLSENLPDSVDLGEAALAFNAFYNQGKQGKAFSAAKNMELLSPEQRQYAYNLGIMDKALESSKQNIGKVLQSETKHDKINNNKESAENEQSIRLRDGSERTNGNI